MAKRFYAALFVIATAACAPDPYDQIAKEARDACLRDHGGALWKAHPEVPLPEFCEEAAAYAKFTAMKQRDPARFKAVVESTNRRLREMNERRSK